MDDPATRLARRAGLPLKIAARKPLHFSRDPEVRKDWRYFNEVIQPLLEADEAEFIGEVGGREKEVLRAMPHGAPCDEPECFEQTASRQLSRRHSVGLVFETSAMNAAQLLLAYAKERYRDHAAIAAVHIELAPRKPSQIRGIGGVEE